MRSSPCATASRLGSPRLDRISSALGWRWLSSRTSSEKISPSRMWMMRRVWAAMSGSWVTNATVIPISAFSRRKMARISSLALVSRLPVGSSARMMEGLVTRALAIATRCCWPPDSSVGL